MNSKYAAKYSPTNRIKFRKIAYFLIVVGSLIFFTKSLTETREVLDYGLLMCQTVGIKYVSVWELRNDLYLFIPSLFVGFLVIYRVDIKVK